jgi:L-ascorbate metabolism protein UlaG (beta-lactamase superfamily)
MKITLSIIAIIIIALAGFYFIRKNKPSEMITEINPSAQIVPIMHATSVIKWDNSVFYTDPTGGAVSFQGQSPADIIFITDIHSDHLSTTTLNAVMSSSTIIVPQAVKDLLPVNIAAQTKVLKNGETINEKGYSITAIPMYNLPESTTSPHTKGRGNGYLIEKDGFRVYVAGDTSSIPEMRSLTNIDIALVPMNLPYTMSVEEAAEAVLAFKPKKVYPYHYRGQNGLSDINKFKQLVNQANPNIQVVLENWYPTL